MQLIDRADILSRRILAIDDEEANVRLLQIFCTVRATQKSAA